MLATNIIMLWFPRTWPTHFGITRLKNKARSNKGINITVSQVCAQAVLLKELSCLTNFEYHAAWLDIVTFGLANTTSF